MVGSPNYVRFVYDGEGSAMETAGPNGSAMIEGIFLDYFSSQSLAAEPTAFDGRSDYGRSSTSAYRPGACSPAPRRSRRRSRPRSTAAQRASPMTRAITSCVTTSTTSTWPRWMNSATRGGRGAAVRQDQLAVQGTSRLVTGRSSGWRRRRSRSPARTRRSNGRTGPATALVVAGVSAALDQGLHRQLRG